MLLRRKELFLENSVSINLQDQQKVAIIADKTSDKEIVAADIVGQVEHGYNSPAWLITHPDKTLADFVSKVPELVKSCQKYLKKMLKRPGRIMEKLFYVKAEEMLETSDKYASEHLEVHAENLNWWLENLKNYGSLFLGEETTSNYGDYCSGTNHIYQQKVQVDIQVVYLLENLKTLTFQRMTKDATKTIGPNAARLGRAEGMEGHARTCDARLKKVQFPTNFFLTSSGCRQFTYLKQHFNIVNLL